MKRFIIFTLSVICFFALAKDAFGQKEEDNFTIQGKVVDKNNKPIPGVHIFIKNFPGIGSSTNEAGHYSLKMTAPNILVFSFVGYERQEILVAEPRTTLDVKLLDETKTIEEVRVVGHGVQRKESVVGAISTVNIEELKSSPVTSIANMFAGRVAGVIALQHSGEPGEDVSEFWIRGISTFGAGSSALILIDGVERTKEDFANLSPEDIESFSILKDATATAVYGARGGNGVIIINTKKGVEGKMQISANVKYSLETLPSLPEYLRAHDYAKLANEALAVRGQDPLYDENMFDIIKYHLDPNLYPDVNWQKELLKKTTWGMLGNVSVSGGGAIARYFMSLGVRTNDAAYNSSGLKSYNTNVLRKQYSFRTNLDVNVTKTTVVALNLSSTIVNLNRPGIGTTDQIWAAQANLNPLMVPTVYTNGQFPAYNNNQNMTSPTVLLNQTGYVQNYTNSIQSALKVRQNLKMLTDGLSASAVVSFDTYSTQTISRSKMPELFRAIGYAANGNLITEKVSDARKAEVTMTPGISRKVYFEMKVDYSRMFAEAHRVSGLLLYNQSSRPSSDFSDALSSIPYRQQGFAGRATYGYRDIYFAEFNFGYNGTENFPKNERFNFFPSMAIGWLPSNYDYVKDNFAFVSKFKIRYSYGSVGNDQMSVRFPYLSKINDGAGGFSTGNFGNISNPGLAESELGSVGLVWERAIKNNLGLEFGLWDKLNLEIDYFHDTRSSIFMRRENIPLSAGFPGAPPYANVGKMKNYGVDGTVSYVDRIKDSDFSYEIRGNFTVTRNKVVDMEEPTYEYPYLYKKGKSLDVTRGYIALGYFKDETDVARSPRTGEVVMPGDIKYKDVNGDGVINELDMVPIGNSKVPRISYGFAASTRYKAFELSLFFRGAAAFDYFYGGNYFPFIAKDAGNVLSIVNDASSRWIPASYSGDQATENPNARFPRLTYGPNRNNYLPSTHWLANGTFLRLKTVELAYTLPRKFASVVGMNSCRVSVIGDNLHVWDNVKQWDPEQVSSNGSVYPLTRSFTFNLQVTF